jgi:hypothetical protein
MNGEATDRDYDRPMDVGDAQQIMEDQRETARSIYSDPHFIWKGRLVESDFKVYVERELNPRVVSSTTLFSMSTKLALLRIINAFFDKNTPLSNIDSVERCKLNLEYALVKAILAMKEYDRNNPQLVVALDSIRNAYFHLITRAKGGEERKLQNKLEQSLETTQRVVHTNSPQKRGFLGLGIGGGK